MNYEITQELAKSGHQLAALLGTQHGMLDASSLVQRMAGQLDVLIAVLREKTKQCEQIAAENAALMAAIQTHSGSVHFCEVCGKDDPCSTDDVCYALKETTATNAFLREVRAQGVEMFADSKYCREESQSGAHEFAAELRKGGAA
ncbi:hypothetical protein ACSDIA_003755 [Cronobacter turicensis]